MNERGIDVAIDSCGLRSTEQERCNLVARCRIGLIYHRLRPVLVKVVLTAGHSRVYGVVVVAPPFYSELQEMITKDKIQVRLNRVGIVGREAE